jgi:hypothetical protein
METSTHETFADHPMVLVDLPSLGCVGWPKPHDFWKPEAEATHLTHGLGRGPALQAVQRLAVRHQNQDFIKTCVEPCSIGGSREANCRRE